MMCLDHPAGWLPNIHKSLICGGSGTVFCEVALNNHNRNFLLREGDSAGLARDRSSHCAFELPRAIVVSVG